ncbi:MAG: hypothetical protein OEZ10_07550 [Gammaproteobacteria bacterium]|nr:hypothetical protein [Gammaproteobacteria bacterium]
MYDHECPLCQSAVPPSEGVCACGFSFNPTPEQDQAQNVLLDAQEDLAYENYLVARQNQTREAVAVATTHLNNDPDNADRKAALNAAKREAEVAEQELAENHERLTEIKKAITAAEAVLAKSRATREVKLAAIRAEMDRKAQEEAARKAREEATLKAKQEAERKAKAEAERKAREAAELKAREQAVLKAKQEAERKAKAEAERKAREAAEKAREQTAEQARKHAEAQRKAKAAEEAKAAQEAETARKAARSKEAARSAEIAKQAQLIARAGMLVKKVREDIRDQVSAIQEKSLGELGKPRAPTLPTIGAPDIAAGDMRELTSHVEVTQSTRHAAVAITAPGIHSASEAMRLAQQVLEGKSASVSPGSITLDGQAADENPGTTCPNCTAILKPGQGRCGCGYETPADPNDDDPFALSLSDEDKAALAQFNEVQITKFG